MREQKSFVRKVVYLAIMAVLLVPLSMLSQPERGGAQPDSGSGGGTLAEMRRDNQLSQASLGEIDPTGEALKLGLVGLRGVAANVLWHQAEEFKKKQDWTNLSATLEQITKLQPNFVSVWRYQGWNLSYNVSVEFDNYRDRYYWVIRGIEFLNDGQQYNWQDTRLFWDEGWFTAFKIGRADEQAQFRRLFKNNEVISFRSDLPPGAPERDSWRVGRESFLDGIRLVENHGDKVRITGINPLLFFSEPTKCHIRYATALVNEGTFGDVARRWWRTSLDEWLQFGKRPFATSVGEIYRVEDAQKLQQQAQDLLKQLEELAPGVREELQDQRSSALTLDEKARLERYQNASPTDDPLSERELEIIADIQRRINVTHMDVAEAVEGPQRKEAIELAKDIFEAQGKANRVRLNTNVVNYEFWVYRIEAELSQRVEAGNNTWVGVPEPSSSTPDTLVMRLSEAQKSQLEEIPREDITHQEDIGLTARRLIFNAKQLYADGNILGTEDEPGAIEVYEQAFAKWRENFDAYPSLVNDGEIRDDLMFQIRNYDRALRQDDRRFPKPFILEDFLDRWDDGANPIRK